MFVRKWIFLDTHFEGEWLLGQYFGSMKKLTFFYSFVYLSFEGIFFIFCLADENSFQVSDKISEVSKWGIFFLTLFN
ncbi:hypothetical protein GLOIN_2v1470412 [Rhizophagus irregularis DAOM 181602=DAOM 197198]|nr:hypothetical protein GLOIN_2v1470412 [Rhizophagus irregularis DAOM 181602=DAOM 197198]